MSIIDFYQKYISRLIAPNKCRYFPTCSQYAKELYKFDNPFNATIKTILRILSCNQLFIGGISYPKITINTSKLRLKIQNPKYFLYWFIPTNTNHANKQQVYIIKNYNKAIKC